ncbi:MAG: hypothetical protein DRN35_03815 [Thermoplasmata archaeon]|nr:MAG: hypothetical protein DRN35_03815 [Thermoplasmata archaeon]RLF73041.1 MAG: hypothetical protein DRN55_04730 [Thermoplasmata archaeon]HDD59539.1 DUF2156 domain-containing protein [Euryarchaeota archaeon]
MFEDAFEADLTSVDLLRRFYNLHPPPHSDLSLGNILCWKDFYKVHCLPKGGNLAFLIKTREGEYVVPPLGPPNYGLLMEVLKEALKEAWGVTLYGFQALSLMKEYFPSIRTVPQRDLYDYVYLTQKLAEMRGRDFLKIRNELNSFRRCFKAERELIEEGNLEEVKSFARRWCIWKDCESKELLRYEKKALFYALEHFTQLPIEGILLRVEDRIEALSIFERLSPDTYVIHFEKANYNMKGCYPAITRATAEFLREKCYFLNRESDMGVPGLRKAKQKLRPHHLIEVHSLEKNTLGEILNKS